MEAGGEDYPALPVGKERPKCLTRDSQANTRIDLRALAFYTIKKKKKQEEKKVRDNSF